MAKSDKRFLKRKNFSKQGIFGSPGGFSSPERDLQDSEETMRPSTEIVRPPVENEGRSESPDSTTSGAEPLYTLPATTYAPATDAIVPPDESSQLLNSLLTPEPTMPLFGSFPPPDSAPLGNINEVHHPISRNEASPGDQNPSESPSTRTKNDYRPDDPATNTTSGHINNDHINNDHINNDHTSGEHPSTCTNDDQNRDRPATSATSDNTNHDHTSSEPDSTIPIVVDVPVDPVTNATNNHTNDGHASSEPDSLRPNEVDELENPGTNATNDQTNNGHASSSLDSTHSNEGDNPEDPVTNATSDHTNDNHTSSGPHLTQPNHGGDPEQPPSYMLRWNPQANAYEIYLINTDPLVPYLYGNPVIHQGRQRDSTPNPIRSLVEKRTLEFSGNSENEDELRQWLGDVIRVQHDRMRSMGSRFLEEITRLDEGARRIRFVMEQTQRRRDRMLPVAFDLWTIFNWVEHKFLIHEQGQLPWEASWEDTSEEAEGDQAAGANGNDGDGGDREERPGAGSEVPKSVKFDKSAKDS